MCLASVGGPDGGSTPADARGLVVSVQAGLLRACGSRRRRLRFVPTDHACGPPSPRPMSCGTHVSGGGGEGPAETGLDSLGPARCFAAGSIPGLEPICTLARPLLSLHPTHGPQVPGPRSAEALERAGRAPRVGLSRVRGRRPRVRRDLTPRGEAGARTVRARTLSLAVHLGGHSGARPLKRPPKGPVTPSWSSVSGTMGTTWLFTARSCADARCISTGVKPSRGCFYAGRWGAGPDLPTQALTPKSSSL